MIILVAVHSAFSSEIPPIRLVHLQSKAFFTPSRFIGSLDLNGCFNTSSCLQTWTISSNNPSEGFSLRKMIHLPPDWLWQEFSEPPQTQRAVVFGILWALYQMDGAGNVPSGLPGWRSPVWVSSSTLHSLSCVPLSLHTTENLLSLQNLLTPLVAVTDFNSSCTPSFVVSWIVNQKYALLSFDIKTEKTKPLWVVFVPQPWSKMSLKLNLNFFDCALFNSFNASHQVRCFAHEMIVERGEYWSVWASCLHSAWSLCRAVEERNEENRVFCMKVKEDCNWCGWKVLQIVMRCNGSHIDVCLTSRKW